MRTDYRNFTVDKPDLLIYEKLWSGNVIWSGLCNLGKNDTKGRLMMDTSISAFEDSFEFDSYTNEIYVVSKNRFENEIYKVQLDESLRSYLFSFPTDESSIEPFGSIALDWVTKNIYAIHEGAIKVFNVQGNLKIPRWIADVKSDKHPVIKIFPNEGYLVVNTGKYILLIN